jgi:D-3-phosphoglycerate dehydrogenase / 2-oxoglutarate reductase
MSLKILSTVNNFTTEAEQILSKLGSVDNLDLNQEELVDKITNYDVLIVQLGLRVSREVIDKADKLKVIATATTGLDHIDVEYAKQKNIEILSLKEETEFLSTITSTAELAFGLMIDLMRLNHTAFESVKNYQWDREKFRGHSLYGQTLGIVGLGRLGKLMANYSNAFNMKVLAYDPHIDDGVFSKYHVEKVDFDQLLTNSDAISIHVHLSSKTENLFNNELFKKMKSTAYLINTARGRLVNESDLLKALKNEEIAGYATDGLADELSFNESFSSHPMVEYSKRNNNLVIVPHTGGTTYESREATDIFIAKKTVNYFKK